MNARIRAGLCAFAFTLLPAASQAADLERLIADPAAWPIQTGDYANTRYSKLDQIDRSNVGDLRLAWTFSTGVLRGHEGGPLVVGNLMYVHTPFPNVVYALDLDNDGAIVWKYEPQQSTDAIEVMCCDTVYRGLAYDDGTIFLHQADTTIVALDAATGEVKWQVKNGDPARGEVNTATVLPIAGKLIVGMAGGEFGAHCPLTAYDERTGKRLWRAYATGPDSDMLVDPEKTTELGKPVGPNSSLESWEGEQWQIGGACPWGWFSADPDLGLVYYGTGNPSTWNPVQRPGDNRWSNAIIARDIETGVARWVYQMTPHDEWDYDGVNEMVLTEQEIDGQSRRVLTHFDRNGFAYTLDRATGELLVAEKFDPSVNWAKAIDMDPESGTYGRPILDPAYSTDQDGEGEDVETAGICPGAPGAKNEQPSAYSPRTKLFYVPTNHVCMDYEPFRVAYTAGLPYVGATLKLYPAAAGKGFEEPGIMGSLTAWDGAAGKIAWAVPERFSVWSGVLATAGDVVFYGTLEGYLKAVDATTGDELFRFKTPSGIVGNVTTYEHDGKQYVAVLSGVGGWAGIGLAAGLTDPQDGSGAVGAYESLSRYTATGGVLSVFALP
ncbi:methanol/ethanol family PQQ-dependent dehydrogenase [Aurantimonas sp. VKM B-3413]|uniref:methanol/ethanol family PQQ-dependent dehydrogenase n=1 Tax=Aurantimonas sp. VKM B-3413 TaxID=2779401 RepID=UPI001E2E28B5|nr:methanol/ethanol family PQQ-dependent dehydrogenase [Aurantimonas sp. VKM B-3413]MCB8837494.1 methanol/ethanol family PQQ-dependent dehydrogenase [Aurantimonas sp. VKM B-3413]